ncbi:hypothetical protein HRbin30_02704 [bacterium HR30]|nr:hypothetical protein HRbin30_02704 [bacterium HR30]
MNFVSPDQAEGLFGKNFFGPADVERSFRGPVQQPLPPIPFPSDILREAAAEGFFLVFRDPAVGGAPFVLERAVHSFPDLFDSRYLQKVGYQLKDEWGILLEPLARTETPRKGWALVRKQPLPGSANRTYQEQTKLLRQWAQPWEVRGLQVRRRLAVEIVYDCLLVYLSRGERLLEREWDWSASTTVDGGFLNVGGFGENGLQIFSYSGAVRHSALGVCPEIRNPLEEN